MAQVAFSFLAMRKLFILFIVSVFSFLANAQKLETNTEFYTGYLTTTNFDRNNTIKSIEGVLYFIYDNIPIALVKYPAMKTDEEFEIPSTVRRICNNAFQGTKFLKTLKIHNTVTEGAYVNLAIGEDAFNDSSIENFIVIENDVNNEASYNVPKIESIAKTDVARYDLNGRKVDENTEGIQIVVYDDNTAQTIYNKKK